MHADERRLNEITERIIGCAYRVANELGCGFLEKVYENALLADFLENGIAVRAQYPITVYYHVKVVGEYVADFVIDDCIIVEFKAVKAIDDVHRAQCINYLKATGYRICLLIDFGGPNLEIKSIVHQL